ncbi:Maf family nucleotide pyrophosphatase [Lysobacter sp. GX 14042]|uniref:Maf family protein n=1 Tax=Lysobacter sp. GX 14042 TaxID=2907155 RepID=UPI001F32BBCD|nr:Maf family protein [Lysobacter sp. GX 14042]MCE7033146.1 Maf family nucleotide pyrophosphatase [Lysobacter sp. GX 14042]
MLHLASKSPRRRELLARLGIAFDPLDVEIPEQRAPGESPHDYVRRVATGKAAAGRVLLGDAGAMVLGSDTEVVLEDEVFGKPADAADARGMLQRLSGRTHEVLSAVTLLAGGEARQALSISQVTFARLDPALIEAYAASGEPHGKAGGYAIQGAAEVFVTRLEGSFSGVMGLPLHETAMLLRDAGLQISFAMDDMPMKVPA